MFAGYTLGLNLIYFCFAIISAFAVEDELITRLLNQEASKVELHQHKTGELIQPNMSFAKSYQDFEALPVFAQRALKQGITDNEIFTPEKDHYHIIELALADGQVGYLMAEVSILLVVTNTPYIFELFLVGLIFTLIISFILAIKMASWTVKPVMAMVGAIEQKQPLPQLKFELGYLSKAMQTSFDDLSDSLQREKDFTRDVSHELRTPLTVLNNTITLAKQRGLQESDLEHLRIAGEQMLHTVEVLLALARAEQIERQSCLLKPLVEQVGMSCALAHNVELGLNLVMEDDFQVQANASLLNLLLTNMINNAIVHSSDQQLTIQADSTSLIFHNFSEHQVSEEVVMPGVKGAQSQGIGQGLYLVTRIIESLGWKYQLHRAEKQFMLTISL